ncbi:MAG: histidine--tRNA ligase [Ectothiorhodospiraceae bacterium]|nr:histidine--tRNA ligase [Chromatiales bacterium]MCP5154988.1 histidine--tRNA ligase [Ectothiorhodospiraceae bacterium]
MTKITGIRGMNDISPSQTPAWQMAEHAAREVLATYGYREVRPPIVERTELFRRSVGEGTDIVEKEMYTFTDRGGDSLTLRPECTASCVRAAIEHGWLREGGQRIWHIGPMFRYERPQKGRYRQFHQLDVECLGFPGPDVDAELMLILARLWRRLGLEGLELQINSLGSRPTQARYRELLVEYFQRNRDALDDDSQRRLTTNPLRILDSKNPEMQQIVADAPSILDHLDPAEAAHLDGIRAMLDQAGLAYSLNPRLVRGLDYYTSTVFEWVTNRLGAQNAVCGGGRYDGLVAEVGGGGQSAPAIGFALGMERLVALLEEASIEPPASAPDAYLVAVGDAAAGAAHALAERVRDALPELRLVVDAAPGGMRAKMKRADRSGARMALILGDDEVAARTVSLKPLRSDSQQSAVAWAELPVRLAAEE